SAMVFAGVSATGRTPLIFVEKDVRIDKNVYVEILNNRLLPCATEHYENGHWILQQDGSPAHLAKPTEYWCLANLPDASEWPANSPGLNVLDFSIWVMLEQKACRKKHTSVQALRKCLEEARNEIPHDHVLAMEAYLKRLKAVIRAKGGHIE
ncbi:hypothetical protein ANCDUO_05939, partial [Ancylostoma duodenale]